MRFPLKKKLAQKEPEKTETPKNSGGSGLNDFMESGLPEDYFPNYKVGEHTYLSVLRFPKVSYFVRLKKIFNTTWNPRSALMYSGMNQLAKGQVEVVLGLSVDKDGNLAEMFVINSSGLPLYDQEAQRTIKDSSPFAAPPKELLDASSRLRMVWTFTVYM
ncbi:MAG: energy transducer TonB [Deltaproteobacteria bacterium]|nr:MAG: energy transducer TonB [Deltaproteobacteria bacterium]